MIIGKYRQAAAIAIGGVLATLALAARDAQAIPAFARKYATSCTTCHVAFPKLNPFGEAFRIAGYQIPGDDESFVKQEPVSMGNAAYKRIFPGAVWPSELIANFPAAIRATGAVVGNTIEENGQKKFATDFRFPTALNLYTAGTLAEDISLWAGIHLFLNGEAGELGKLFFNFNNLFDKTVPQQLFNLRAGLFVPGYLAFDHHRNITFATPVFSLANAVNGVPRGVGHAHSAGTGEGGGHGGHGSEGPAETYSPGFALGTGQVGFELYGLPAPRLEYTLGAVNGGGPSPLAAGQFDNNFGKNIYGRLRFKLGGMGFDGSVKSAEEAVVNTEGEPALRDQKAWVDNSVILGVVGISGRERMTLIRTSQATLYDRNGFPVLLADGDPATVAEVTEETYANTVSRYGADLAVNLGNFELLLAAMQGNDTNPRASGAGVKSLVYMAQLDWVSPWPWLIVSARMEGARFSPAESAGLEDVQQGVVSLTALARANVRLQLEAQKDFSSAADEIANDYVVGVIDASF